MSTEVPIARRDVVYKAPGADAVSVRRDIPFRGADGDPLTLDAYGPGQPGTTTRRPAVVIVAGYRDEGFLKFVGCRFKEMQSVISWARLIAASGMVAITYTNRDPAGDVFAALRAVRENAEALGIDENRIGIWASSGNVPVALSLLMQDSPEPVRCAAFLYGCMLDLGGSTAIADTAATFKFVNPTAGRSMDDVQPGTPLFLARAGRDEVPAINESIDRFLRAALDRNLPVTLVNHPDAPHAFDLLHDSDTSREIIRQILRFLQFHLGVGF